MAQSSILGGTPTATRPRGSGTESLGPSDSSDSGSDVQGERALATDAEDGGAGALPADMDSDTDAAGTGERGAATGRDSPDGADILPDRVTRGSPDALDDAERIDVEDLADEDIDDDETAT